MDTPPNGVWEALVAFFAAATIYLGVLTGRARKEARTQPRAAMEPEAVRKLVDERTEHKVNNALNGPLARLSGLEADVERNQERLDDLDETGRNKGERLVRVESQVEAIFSRMDARDKAAEIEREEDVAWRGRIDGKLDRLILGGRA